MKDSKIENEIVLNGKKIDISEWYYLIDEAELRQPYKIDYDSIKNPSTIKDIIIVILASTRLPISIKYINEKINELFDTNNNRSSYIRKVLDDESVGYQWEENTKYYHYSLA